jgi:hypothetical protein
LSIAIGLILPLSASAATGTIMPSPVQVVLDANGNPVASACIWTYTAGTSTAINTYTDVGLTVANANPIIANSGPVHGLPDAGFLLQVRLREHPLQFSQLHGSTHDHG